MNFSSSSVSIWRARTYICLFDSGTKSMNYIVWFKRKCCHIAMSAPISKSSTNGYHLMDDVSFRPYNQHPVKRARDIIRTRGHWLWSRIPSFAKTRAICWKLALDPKIIDLLKLSLKVQTFFLRFFDKNSHYYS